jgi:hypothetical protein
MCYFPLFTYVCSNEDIFWNTSFDFFERKLAEMPGKPQSAFFEGFYVTQTQACILYTVYQ